MVRSYLGVKRKLAWLTLIMRYMMLADAKADLVEPALSLKVHIHKLSIPRCHHVLQQRGDVT